MWKNRQRKLIADILDELVPASADGRVPAAGKLGVADFLFSAASGLEREHLASLAALAERFSEDPDATSLAQRLEVEAPEAFRTLLTLTYKGYYSRPGIRPLFGLSERPVHPSGYEVARESDELLAELTAPVTHRGPCYRNV